MDLTNYLPHKTRNIIKKSMPQYLTHHIRSAIIIHVASSILDLPDSVRSDLQERDN